jgi:hypothetical protein
MFGSRSSPLYRNRRGDHNRVNLPDSREVAKIAMATNPFTTAIREDVALGDHD